MMMMQCTHIGIKIIFASTFFLSDIGVFFPADGLLVDRAAMVDNIARLSRSARVFVTEPLVDVTNATNKTSTGAYTFSLCGC